MDTSTDYMTALNMPISVFLDCYNTLSLISENRNQEYEKEMNTKKNKK